MCECLSRLELQQLFKCLINYSWWVGVNYSFCRAITLFSSAASSFFSSAAASGSSQKIYKKSYFSVFSFRPKEAKQSESSVDSD